MSENQESALRGGLYLCLAMLCAAVLDVSAKALSADYGTAQIVFLRALLAVPVALLICWYQGAIRGLLQPLWGWQLYRGSLVVGANFGFFYGVAHIDLVTALMLAYTAPILIVLIARFVLAEAITWRRAAGVLAGFLGVCIVLAPNGLAVHPAMLAVLASAVCWALLAISNRQLGGKVDPAVLAFYTAPLSALVGYLVLACNWQSPDGKAWLLFLLMGLMGGLTHLLAAHAYRLAEASRIAPLEYSNLVWAALAAWLFWDEIAGLATWIGGAILLAGGWYALSQRSEGVREA